MQRSDERSSLPPWIWFGGACLIGLAALVYRRPDAFTAPQFYAEDGRDFFAQAYALGWESLFYRTMGYFTVYPRMVDIIGLSSGLPLVHMPAFHSAGCLAMYLMVWWSIFQAFPASIAGRSLAVLATVLVPVSNEIWMNTTNVQWPMALALPLLCMGRPSRSVLGKARTAFLLIMAAFSGPYALLMAPVVVMELHFRGVRRFDAVPWTAWIVLAGALVNAVALFEHGSVTRTAGSFVGFDPAFIRAAFYQFGFMAVTNDLALTPLPVMIGVLALLPAGWWWIVRDAPVSQRSFARSCGILGVALLGVTLFSYRGDPGSLAPLAGGGRYFYLPAVLFTWSLLASTPGFTAGRSALACLVAVWWGVLTVHGVGRWVHRDHGWPLYAHALDAGVPMIVPITPEGWFMYVSREQPSTWPFPFAPGSFKGP